MSKHPGGWRTKRTEPYTERGIQRLKCIRCGGKAEFQWNICSDNGYYRPICKECDILLNKTVLEFMKHPNSDRLIKIYEQKKR
jgi:NAD-dependent SIR2 family protein deacetylase